ncbi:hypothetical protein D3C76_673070 [compost metagenome]
MKARDLGQLLMQCTHRQVIHVGNGRPEREHALTPGLDQDLLNDAAAGNQAGALDSRNFRGRRRQGRGLVHIIARLRPCPNQALVFEVGVSLQDRCMADVQLRAHLAH